MERFVTWILTGPVGHAACGAADWAELMGGYLLARARGRDPWRAH